MRVATTFTSFHSILRVTEYRDCLNICFTTIPTYQYSYIRKIDFRFIFWQEYILEENQKSMFLISPLEKKNEELGEGRNKRRRTVECSLEMRRIEFFFFFL